MFFDICQFFIYNVNIESTATKLLPIIMKQITTTITLGGISLLLVIAALSMLAMTASADAASWVKVREGTSEYPADVWYNAETDTYAYTQGNPNRWQSRAAPQVFYEGDSIEVHPGEQFTVSVRRGGSGGYWTHVQWDSGALKEVEGLTMSRHGWGWLCIDWRGCSAQPTITFEAVAVGTTSLSFRSAGLTTTLPVTVVEEEQEEPKVLFSDMTNSIDDGPQVFGHGVPEEDAVEVETKQNRVSTSAYPGHLEKVRALAGQKRHGSTHTNRWNSLLVAYGEPVVGTYTGAAITATTACANQHRFSSPEWHKACRILSDL